MRIDVVTGFPDILERALNESIIRQGRQKNAVQINLHNLRDFTDDRHRTIDDYPYGGGPGMVLKAEPVARALDKIFSESSKDTARIVLTSPRGETLKQPLSVKLSLEEHLIILCGHYKGIDERIRSLYPLEEISIGDYILSGGEVAALVIVDSIVRLLPGVIKDIDSAWTDSFSDDLLDVPYYTRPESFRGFEVPKVLLSGNHKLIGEWRREIKKKQTKERRPDLYKKYNKSIKDESE